jgi:hypothetical protein
MPIANVSWPHAFALFWRTTPGNPQLEDLCVLWLKHAVDHPHWIAAFDPVWQTGRHRELLVALAQRRLQQQPEGKDVDRLNEILAEEMGASAA